MSLLTGLQSRMVLLLMVALFIPHGGRADTARVIELSDGSRISGVIVDYRDGIYTIQSETLGRVQLQDAQIRSIQSATQTPRQPNSLDLAPSSSAVAGPSVSRQLEQLQTRIMAEPEVLSLVISLQQDPDLLAILNDPLIMQAIMSGHIGTLQEHPKFRQLEHNPTIQKIMQMLNP